MRPFSVAITITILNIIFLFAYLMLTHAGITNFFHLTDLLAPTCVEDGQTVKCAK